MKLPFGCSRFSVEFSALLLLLTLTGRGDAQVTSTWNVANGNWNVAANWSPSTNFPNNGNGGNTYSVGLINSGTLTLNTAIIIENYTQTNGTLTGGAFTLTINQVLRWVGGTIGGLGTVSVTGGIAITGTDTKTLGTGSNAGRTLINRGTANFSGGPLFISSSGGTTPGSQFDNRGTFNATDEADLAH